MGNGLFWKGFSNSPKVIASTENQKKRLLHAKETLSREEKPMEWDRIFASYLSDRD